MRQLLILILTLSILTSCNQKKSAKTQTEFKPKTELKAETKPELKKQDTTVVYWQTDFDTIRKNQEVKIENETHQLELNPNSALGKKVLDL